MVFECCAADTYSVSVSQHGLALDDDSVECGTVPAIEVDEVIPLIFQKDFRVLSTGCFLWDHDLTRGRASQDNGLIDELEDGPDAFTADDAQ